MPTTTSSPNARIRSRAFQNIGAQAINQSQEILGKSRSQVRVQNHSMMDSRQRQMQESAKAYYGDIRTGEQNLLHQSRSGNLEEIPETRRVQASRRLTSSKYGMLDEININLRGGEEPMD